MKKYEVEAIKEENDAVIYSCDLFTYSDKEEAIEEAKSIAEGTSSINVKLIGYDFLLVHEVELDEYGCSCGCEEIASFNVK